MTFEEILDQAIAMLQRRGRLTYGALKRQFQLDDAYLDDVKAELIEGQRVAVDEDGRVLVWTGGTAVSPTTTPQAPQSAPRGPPLVTADVQPAQGLPLPAVPQSANAERRQLTVMCCALVDSTALSGPRDPEDLREVVRAYQHVCAAVIPRFDGHSAQRLGDGLLVYCGYPHAHEADTQRAVRTGLGMLAAMEERNSRLRRDNGLQLALRLGIHTGLVVVGAMGGPGRQEQLALGEPPNIAARIQGLAAPNTLMISQATYRLMQGDFECQDVGAPTLRGVSEPVHVYRVLQESGARGRLDVAVTRGLTPLVGREQEGGLLVERWAPVQAGHGHVVFLTGDAGIGKSRLSQVLKEQVAHEPHGRWECQSSEYAQNSALLPLVDLFQRLWRFQAEETSEEKCDKLAQALRQYRLPWEASVPLFAPWLSLPMPEDHSPPLTLSPQRQRQQTLETIVAILLERAEQQPVLFIVEDLHWTDPSTLELLNLVIEQIPTASLLMLLTCRATFQPSWSHRSYLPEVTVNRLSHPQVEQLGNRITDGKTLPQEALHQSIEKTDGVPLLVEEITKSLLESGQLKDVDEPYVLPGSVRALTLPTTLHDSLMARLDRLVTAKAVAQYAAVIGRQFSYGLLQAVSQVDAGRLQHELHRLVETELLYQRGLPPRGIYTFKHALIQDAAYQSVLRSTCQQYHQRIAQVLEAQFPETAETQPALLAYPYTEAGRSRQAVGYWQRAGQRALERSANLEAIGHLTKGREVLTTLPDTPERSQHELALQTALGPALMAVKGYAAPEVAQAYTRARELCRQVGETPQLFPVLFGLWTSSIVRPEFQAARELGECLLRLGQQASDPTLLTQAHWVLGIPFLFMGAFAQARAHLEHVMALYNPQQHRAHTLLSGQDPGATSLGYAALALWYLGYPTQALQRSQQAVTFAQELSHPVSLAFTLEGVAEIAQCRREAHRTQERAEALMTLSTEQRFAFWVVAATVLRGWALAEQGQRAEGMAQIRQGLADWQAMGEALSQPHFRALLAELYGHVGQTEAGLTVLTEVLADVHNTGLCYYEAELYRLKGVLHLQHAAEHQEAEESFQQALVIARHQEAKSLELRTAMSLSRLWLSHGKRAEAYALLAPIYGWFTEGFDTADLQEAKALLDALVSRDASGHTSLPYNTRCVFISP